VTSDPSIVGGLVMHTLLIRAFLLMYEYNSVYAMFPFIVPSKTREVLTKVGTLSSYSFELSKQQLPSIAPPMKSVSSYDACRQILSDPENWKIIWGPMIKSPTGGIYMFKWGYPGDHKPRQTFGEGNLWTYGCFQSNRGFL
jgi:hypothetical protein